MDNVVIEPATRADIDGLLASNAALFAVDAAARDPLRNVGWPQEHGRAWLEVLLDNPDALVLAARSADQVVGHLIGTFFEPTAMWSAPRAELLSMHVSAALRGSGTGRRLVAACIAWARGKGARRLHVSAYAENDGAVRFYQANGFRPFTLELTQDL